MRIFKENRDRSRLAILKDIPVSLEIRQGVPGTAHFRDGRSDQIGCLGCTGQRCMRFSDSDIACDRIEGFPCDRSVNACPVDAIAWDDRSAAPVVDKQRCIRCGICVSRCPVGALYFSDQGEPEVNLTQGDSVVNMRPDQADQELHACQIEQLLQVPRSGVSLQASDQLFEAIYAKLQRLGSAYHNPVGRNLLIALGCRCAMRRIGDVYTRMDAVYTSPAGSVGAIDVDFSWDSLEVPRGVLDDIAVLNARYGVQKLNNRMLAILLQMPNERQGYWQVIQDIQKVEGIKVNTITVGALMFLLWNSCAFEPENDRYHIDFDNMDLRRIICDQADLDSIPLSNGKLGILEPMK